MVMLARPPASLRLVRSSSPWEACSQWLPWGPTQGFSQQGIQPPWKQLFLRVSNLRVSEWVPPPATQLCTAGPLVTAPQLRAAGKVPAGFLVGKVRSAPGCCYQLASGDKQGKALFHSKWGNQVSLNMPLSLCSQPCLIPETSSSFPGRARGGCTPLVRTRRDKDLLSWCLLCLSSEPLCAVRVPPSLMSPPNYQAIKRGSQELNVSLSDSRLTPFPRLSPFIVFFKNDRNW